MLPILVMLLFLFDASTSSPLILNYNISNCYNSSNYLLGSSYEANLYNMLTTLVSQMSNARDGFSRHTQGSQTQDPAYGLALCRGDLNSTDCHDCVKLASEQIRISCPRAKQAILWKEQCMLRYSNESFFSLLQESPLVVIYNINYVNRSNITTTDKDRWLQYVLVTLDQATSLAAFNTSNNMVAAKDAWFPPLNKTLYTLAQCTPDMTKVNCNKCFSSAVNKFYSKMARGGFVLTPSCTVRYEVYQFYQFDEQSLAPPPRDIAKLTNRDRGYSNKKRTFLLIGVPLAAVISILLVYGVWTCMRMRKVNKTFSSMGVAEIRKYSPDCLQFDLNTIQTATSNFAIHNKLGEGGFGEVYKGLLENGKEIAVKRLSKNSGQGIVEFKAEVVLVAELRHKNLVKLLGYCVALEENILVYEFYPNSSLDKIIFDKSKQVSLDWQTRFKIIAGVARGLLYLHQDSPLKIIHRDLKSSNILLDEYMNPKISDFGLAKLFGVDQTQGDTKRIVGTYGYMAPEYAITGQYSAKSDIYSFGVIILEIVSGQRNRFFGRVQLEEALLHRAWRLWNEKKTLDLVDTTLNNNFSEEEVIKCIHIGLLCIQEHAVVRPRMNTIVAALNGQSISLPAPNPPNFFRTTNNVEDDSEQTSPCAYTGSKTITNLCSRD